MNHHQPTESQETSPAREEDLGDYQGMTLKTESFEVPKYLSELSELIDLRVTEATRALAVSDEKLSNEFLRAFIRLISAVEEIKGAVKASSRREAELSLELQAYRKDMKSLREMLAPCSKEQRWTEIQLERLSKLYGLSPDIAKDFHKNWAKFVVKEIKKRGMTRRGFAKKILIAESNLSMYFTMKIVPPLKVFEKINNALGILHNKGEATLRIKNSIKESSSE